MNKFRKHDRKVHRLKGYDYSKSGYYFITICVADRFHLFGKIIKEQIKLNEYGKIAEEEWRKTEKLRNNVRLDEFIVMPNHVHGIIELFKPSSDTARRVTTERFGKPVRGSLPTIVRSYKSAVTKQINELNEQRGDKVWQKNYYDHIVRNHEELNRIRKYIKDNPKNWEHDKLNIE
ncbi:transposase [Fodinibius salsisoli]|uniref:Transposase n=1 Tax=Fodinibius salsisoli TaxID=2820877 RepID=A0ABT3PRQ0_9BACT|nr:transposase [Fodinibius salsisoli]MCW9708538.1 transposase [Fodinibius salsisoli]